MFYSNGLILCECGAPLMYTFEGQQKALRHPAGPCPDAGKKYEVPAIELTEIKD